MRINLKHITIISGLALAAGCGGDDKGKDDLASADMHVPGDGPSSNTDGPGPVCAQTFSSTEATVTVAGNMINPETAWIGGYPFIQGQTVQWYNECNTPTAVSGPGVPGTSMAAWTLLADQGQTVRPEVVGTDNVIPSLSDNLTIGTQAPTGIPSHFWLKVSTAPSGSNNAISTLLAGAGGPSQADVIAQGACLVEGLTSHINGNPVPDYASITADAGYDIYTIHGDSRTAANGGTQTLTVTKDGNGGNPATEVDGVGTARFLITKNGATAPATINYQITDQSGQGFHWTSHTCSIVPGYFSFEPTVHDS